MKYSHIYLAGAIFSYTMSFFDTGLDRVMLGVFGIVWTILGAINDRGEN